MGATSRQVPQSFFGFHDSCDSSSEPSQALALGRHWCALLRSGCCFGSHGRRVLASARRIENHNRRLTE
ncbi:hypothetical protein NDU88_006634 [Pleurodeles waltl]|uniref:Uncharacterized protein n=1 Tax=Pleurodeles waltl TaxID=8319 RepID=A0AAV7LRD4_PLEWA|nr:hypothetical protein NDU88_006634 [Pleurodeles waltl]